MSCFINKSSLISRISIIKRLDVDAEGVVKEREDERKDSGKSREETSAVAPTRKALDLSHTSRGVTKGRRESIEPKQRDKLLCS